MYLLTLITVALVPHTAHLADWRSTGPFGGDAEVIRVVPKVPGFVIAGAHNGLLYVSRNGGAFWNNIPFDGQSTGTLHALEVDPRSADTWYVGMEGDHPWTSGVYKTVDAGETWTLLAGTKGKPSGPWPSGLPTRTSWLPERGMEFIAAPTRVGVGRRSPRRITRSFAR